MRYVAFLRAINVGGHTVKMDVLTQLFETMGFGQVETFIASGNVIFNSPSKDAAALEKKIEATLAKKLGYEVATFVRSLAELKALADYPAFTAAQLKRAGAHNVIFLKDALATKRHAELDAFKSAIDSFHICGRELYWLCHTRQSDSKFSNVRLERELKLQATFRGMNTVKKLLTKYAADVAEPPKQTKAKRSLRK